MEFLLNFILWSFITQAKKWAKDRARWRDVCKPFTPIGEEDLTKKSFNNNVHFTLGLPTFLHHPFVDF
jgi:hypothetical protein